MKLTQKKTLTYSLEYEEFPEIGLGFIKNNPHGIFPLNLLEKAKTDSGEWKKNPPVDKILSSITSLRLVMLTKEAFRSLQTDGRLSEIERFLRAKELYEDVAGIRSALQSGDISRIGRPNFFIDNNFYGLDGKPVRRAVYINLYGILNDCAYLNAVEKILKTNPKVTNFKRIPIRRYSDDDDETETLVFSYIPDEEEWKKMTDSKGKDNFQENYLLYDPSNPLNLPKSKRYDASHQNSCSD